MEYRALGPLEVLDGSGHKLPLGGVRQQTVLASLLLRAGQTVGLERLVDELWEEPPATAARTIQAYVSRLRHLLPANAIESRPGGYALLLNGARLDLQTFEQTAEEGRAALASGEHERAAQLLRQALALWRGPALAGLTSDALRREAARLEELRFEVLEDRLEADIASDHQREVVPELQALVAEQPFRERLLAQLMLALYRSGRQTEALAAYQDARRTLVDELGVEPSARLRELEQAILRQEASLEAGALPSGTVTLLFTDIEGSTLLLRELGERFAEALDDHRRILRAAFAAHGGREVDTQGDSFFAAFHRAADAVAAAIEAQTALAEAPTQIRLGLHTGEPELTDHGYTGLDVVRGARLCAAGHGGQILLSETTRALVDVEVRDLGQHWLKDLPYPERIYQIGNEEFPPLRSLNQSNLALQTTELVGRRSEVEEAARLLNEEGTRLLTLVGPPGVGKTRVALQLASELTEQFQDGVFLVGLASIADPALVGNQIAQTVGARGALEDHFRSLRILLVLDNFEHVLEAAPLLAELTAAGPGLRIIATSREPLHLTGERQFPVRPLALDDAVRLFVARAREVGCELEADPFVAEICRRLDLLPLAIELAAARTKVLSPEALLARLERRLELLTGGARDLPERQRTLRSTIEWSYELLNEEERRLFARLAVFAGGCALEAAEEVCDGTLDQLASLVDKSLVVLDDGRLSLHETIREFGLELLDDASDAQDLRRRHARFFVELYRSGEATDSFPSIGGSFATVAGRRFRERLAPDLDNVRTALEWVLAADEIELAVELLYVCYEANISARELATWYDRTLGRVDSVAPATAAAAFRSAAFSKTQLGQYAEARRLCERSIALYRTVGDPAGEGNALRSLGTLSVLEDRPEEARRCFEEALAIAKEHGLDDLRTVAIHALGEFEREVGHLAEAAELLMQSIELSRAAGNLGQTGAALHGLGDLRLDEGNLDAAEALYLEALAIARDLMYEFLAINCLGGLAASAAKRGEVERAGKIWGSALAREEDYGWPLRGRERVRYERALAGVAGPRFEAAMAEGKANDLDAIFERLLREPRVRR